MCNSIADSAEIGKGCVLGHNVVIMNNAQIGDNVYIGHNVVVHEGTIIGANSHVEDGSILGRVPRSGAASTRQVKKELPPLKIGDSCVIGTNVILYRGTVTGNKVLIGDLASIREENTIGNRSIVGRLVMMEPNTKLGDHVIIQSGTHITGESVIEDNVFMGTEVSSTNDNSMGKRQVVYRGVYIKQGARIGSNSTLLPGVTIGKDSVVASGAIANCDVPDGKVIASTPSKIICDASALDAVLSSDM